MELIMDINELEYYGQIFEIKGKDFLKIDRTKFKLIKLGTKEETYERKDGKSAIYISKRWGVIVPKGLEKEFADVVKDKWVLPEELEPK